MYGKNVKTDTFLYNWFNYEKDFSVYLFSQMFWWLRFLCLQNSLHLNTFPKIVFMKNNDLFSLMNIPWIWIEYEQPCFTLTTGCIADIGDVLIIPVSERIVKSASVSMKIAFELPLSTRSIQQQSSYLYKKTWNITV